MMLEKEQQRPAYPLAPAAIGTPRSDEESSNPLNSSSNELHRKKRKRCLLYVIIFVVFQVGVMALFGVTIAKFRNPNFRVRSATFGAFDVASAANINPSFNIVMNTEVSVKNTNFGHFRYQETTIDFYYRDQKVGEGSVWGARAKARDTREFVVLVTLSSANVTNFPELASDLNGGVLPLRSRSRLSGKVKIMVLLKKNRKANMDCTMDLMVVTRELQNIVCR